MAAKPKKTGIKNADDLIALAHAFELDVTVNTKRTSWDTMTHTVRITLPVPPLYNGTDQGRAIAANVLAMIWSKRTIERARGVFVSAILESPDAAPRKVRTLAALDSAVRDLGHEAARLASETAALPEDVVDAPHTLYIGDEQRRAGIPAAQVRRVVTTRRRSRRAVNQDSETGAIHIGDHSYRPDTAHATDTPERFHMRTVNGGTPERIPTRDAVAEMSNAQMKEGRKAVRTASISRSHARIEYRDNRGVVELRPATSEESAADVKPEAERYAPGDHVIVRGVYYDHKTRTHRVLPEYEGTIVNWHGGRYNVRAVELADDNVTYGVRECHVRELRPVIRYTGTVPGCENDPAVRAALTTLRTAYTRIGSIAATPSKPTGGAFLAPEPGSSTGEAGARILHVDGWSEESERARNNAERREEERTERNAALATYATTLRTAGWKVTEYQDSSTDVRTLLYIVAWQPTEEERVSALARQALADGVRLEAQQLAANTVFAEHAAALLSAAGHTDATAESAKRYVFDVDHLAVRLRGEHPDGSIWQDAMDEYAELFEAAGWSAEPGDSVRFGPHLAILPPFERAEEMVREGQRRSVDTAHAQALAEHAQR